MKKRDRIKELIQKNKLEILRDGKQLEKIERRIDNRHATK
ncbi:FbpB family small basic protein [Sporolactobacillus sp. CPB3-1]|uniref:FbpB family small basic protein n=1 Tax=Sporolactobacillus mangiferae TaxID=2940498 RepID=A0ABT0MAB2_9BACL|nr:FbpB family small basic protein [Sporolactobacillus mangiferae]MCL1631792.1 FbpB family small basic protein [Sporolactobacillus mangiferae]